MPDTCAEISVALAKLEAKLNNSTEPVLSTNYATQSDLALVGGGLQAITTAITIAGGIAYFFQETKKLLDKFPGLEDKLNKSAKELNDLNKSGLLDDPQKATIKANAAIIKANIATNIANDAIKKANKATTEANKVRDIANYAIKEANEANKKAKDLITSVNKIVIELNKQGVTLKKQETDLNKAVIQFNTDSKKNVTELTKQKLELDKQKVELTKAQKKAQDAYNGYLENKKELDKISAYNKSNYTYLQQEYKKVNNLIAQSNANTKAANDAKLEAKKATEKANQIITENNKIKQSVSKLQSDLPVITNTSVTALTTAVNLQNNLPKIIGSYTKTIPTLQPISISQVNQNIKKQFDDIKADIETKIATPQKTFEAAQKSINDSLKTKTDLNTKFNDTLKTNITQLEKQVKNNETVNQQAIPLLNQIANTVSQQQQNTKAPTVQEIAQGLLPEIQSIPNATVSALYPPIANQLNEIKNKAFVAPTVAEIAAGILPEVQSIPAATTGALFPPLAGQLTAVSQEISNLKSTVFTLPDETANKVKAFIPPAALPAPDYTTGIATILTLITTAVNQTSPSALQNAATAGVCSTTQPGGCSANLVGNAVNNINANTNAGNAVNAANQAAQTGMLATIISRIGIQLPGGLAGAATRLSTSLGIDRVMNLINFAANLHNALMLSNSLKVTLLEMLSSVGNATGLLQTSEGDNVDLNSVFNAGVENFMILILGAENYAGLKVAWRKHNRIYQAATNSVNAISSMFNSIGNVIETTAEYTGKIGNSLKGAGAVAENAYQWMSEKMNAKMSKFIKFESSVNNTIQVLDTLNEIAESVVEGQQAATEFQKANTEFVKAVADAQKNPGTENKAVAEEVKKQKENATKDPTGEDETGLLSFLTDL